MHAWMPKKNPTPDACPTEMRHVFLNDQDVNYIRSCNTCLLSAYYLPGSILATVDTAVNSRNEVQPSGSRYSGGEGRTCKIIKSSLYE